MQQIHSKGWEAVSIVADVFKCFFISTPRFGKIT